MRDRGRREHGFLDGHGGVEGGELVWVGLEVGLEVDAVGEVGEGGGHVGWVGVGVGAEVGGQDGVDGEEVVEFWGEALGGFEEGGGRQGREGKGGHTTNDPGAHLGVAELGGQGRWAECALGELSEDVAEGEDA